MSRRGPPSSAVPLDHPGLCQPRHCCFCQFNLLGFLPKISFDARVLKQKSLKSSEVGGLCKTDLEKEDLGQTVEDLEFLTQEDILLFYL